MQRVWKTLCLLAVAACSWTAAQAQTFPSKQVTILVGFPAGSPPEIEARFLAQHLEKAWKQSVIVEARAGAGSMIAHQALVSAPPDGHTLLWTSAALAAFKVFIKDLKFDPLKDIAAVSTVVDFPGAFVTSGKLPVKNVDEFVAYAKANPGKLNYASAGQNTVLLIMEAFKLATGAPLTEISYPGQPQYMMALLQNDVQLAQATANLALKTQVDAGDVKVLLIPGSRRSAVFPDVPAAADKGWDIPRNGWQGVIAPAKTPKGIVEQIAAEIGRYVASPEAQKRAQANGIELVSQKPEQFQALIENDSKVWSKVATTIKLQPQ